MHDEQNRPACSLWYRPMSTDQAMAAVFARKAALRKAMLKTLRGLSETELVSQSEAVARVLAAQPFYQQAKSVACYLSMAKGELRTDSLVRDLLQPGKALYTPYLPPANSPDATPVMNMLRLHTPEDLAACPLDKWGILDPGTMRRDIGHEGEVREDVMDASAPDLDLILVPGVAFDADCNRLGRGKAFYDRFLANYSAKKKRPLLVALALEPQLIDEAVPVTPDDFTLDGVVSPAGVIWREGSARA